MAVKQSVVPCLLLVLAAATFAGSQQASDAFTLLALHAHTSGGSQIVAQTYNGGQSWSTSLVVEIPSVFGVRPDALAYCQIYTMAYFSLLFNSKPVLYSVPVVSQNGVVQPASTSQIAVVGSLQGGAAFGAAVWEVEYWYIVGDGTLFLAQLGSNGATISSITTVIQLNTKPLPPINPFQASTIAMLGLGDIAFDISGNVYISSTTVGPKKEYYSRQLMSYNVQSGSAALLRGHRLNLFDGRPLSRGFGRSSNFGQIAFSPQNQLYTQSDQGNWYTISLPKVAASSLPVFADSAHVATDLATFYNRYDCQLSQIPADCDCGVIEQMYSSPVYYGCYCTNITGSPSVSACYVDATTDCGCCIQFCAAVYASCPGACPSS